LLVEMNFDTIFRHARAVRRLAEAPHFAEPQPLAIEFKGLLEIGDGEHRENLHVLPFSL